MQLIGTTLLSLISMMIQWQPYDTDRIMGIDKMMEYRWGGVVYTK